MRDGTKFQWGLLSLWKQDAEIVTGFIDSDLPIAAADSGSRHAKEFLCRDAAHCQVGLSLIPKLTIFASSGACGCSHKKYWSYQSMPIVTISTYNTGQLRKFTLSLDLFLSYANNNK